MTNFSFYDPDFSIEKCYSFNMFSWNVHSSVMREMPGDIVQHALSCTIQLDHEQGFQESPCFHGFFHPDKLLSTTSGVESYWIPHFQCVDDCRSSFEKGLLGASVHELGTNCGLDSMT